MSAAQMKNPQRMYPGRVYLTPAQRKRQKKRYRRILGWSQAEMDAWVARERAEGRPVA